MSGKITESVTIVSPNARDKLTDKEQVIVATKTEFFDGMLTFGWLAERQGSVLHDGALRVIEVNDALRNWLRDNELAPILEEINREGVPIKQFLERILQDEHAGVGSIVAGNLIWITEEVEKLKYQAVALNRKLGKNDYELMWDSTEGQYTVQRTIRFVNDQDDPGLLTGVLAGVRVVAPGAIRLRSKSERDCVDLVSGCQVVREENGWRVARYQGLLQEAFLRVKAIIGAGTKAGTVALMGRNMSHNIGSHALFYMEMDEPSHTKRTFYRYLRERMELMGGFATSMPLYSVAQPLSTVIANFNQNQELLERVARSERVTDVEITLEGRNDCQIALPGGVLSSQALYSLLENNIRDSAKHGRTKGSTQIPLRLRFTASDPEEEDYKEDFIKVVVSDNRGNYDLAKEVITSSLASLRIADPTGKLLPGDWGIKERFICAALLRGLRLEEIPIQLQRQRAQEIVYNLNAYPPEGEPPIIQIENVEGNLGWVFYLLRPKDILLIGEIDPEKKKKLKKRFKDAINIHDLSWLQKTIGTAKVRHRFVLVDVASQAELDHLESLSDQLPYRVIVCLPDKIALSESSQFAPISPEDLNLSDLSLERLYHLWVNYLVELKHPSTETLLIREMRRALHWMRPPKENPNMPEVSIDDDGVMVLVRRDKPASCGE